MDKKCHACHTFSVKGSILISVRELHARTGHYVRKVSGNQRVIVTDHGRPTAELTPLKQTSSMPYFARRKLRPAFRKMQAQGKFAPHPGDRDITELISNDRD